MRSRERKSSDHAPQPYRDAWRRSSLEFFDKFPQEGGSLFLFNGYTGEAIYDVDRWGSPIPGARKLSHWFEPTIQVQLSFSEESSTGRGEIIKLRDLRESFPGNEFRAKWHSAELIQRNIRAALVRWRVARALNRAWAKQYDFQAGRYSFVHMKTGEMQYHKPWGMGTVDLWASDEDEVDEVLLSLFLGVESLTAEETDTEDARGWEPSRRQRRKQYRFYQERNFSEGPHCRICGPGRLKETAFTNVFIYPKKYYRIKPFTHPRDRHCEPARMGSSVVCMDELVEKKLTVDAYFVIRNAREHGALHVLAVMQKYGDDVRVLGVGLQCMAGSLLEEDEAGGATEGQKKYLAKALDVLRDQPNIEWIQAEACAAIASMTSGLCVRKVLEREHPDWLEDIVTAIMAVKSVTQVVKEIDNAGKETRYDVKVPSPMAHLIALHGCRILANMACDEHTRADVARGSVGAVIFVAKLIPDDPVLAATVSTTVYNFVSRQETTHQVVVEAGAEEALEGMLDALHPHPKDRKERTLLQRAIEVLQPDGWRGEDHGLQDKDIPEPRDTSSTEGSCVSHGSNSLLSQDSLGAHATHGGDVDGATSSAAGDLSPHSVY